MTHPEHPRRAPQPGLAGALTLGKGALASRLLGFARDALIASLLGGGALADAFLVAFRLPNFLRRLLAEGSLAYALVPACIRLRQGGAESGRARAFARSVLALSVLCFALAALAGIALARPLALALAPGLAARPETLDLAALFLALCLPYLPLAAGAAVSSGLLLAGGDFRAPSFAPVALNLAMLAAIAAAFVLYGPGRPETPRLLCAGVVLAGAAQWLCQIPALRRAGYGMRMQGPAARKETERRIRFAVLRDPEALAVLRATPAASLGAASAQINALAAALIASFLAEGSISAVYFAERLLEFPLGLIGASLGLSTLAGFSRIAGNASSAAPGNSGPDIPACTACLTESARMAFFCSLPAALGLACLARPLVGLCFGHGAFSDTALAATSEALLAYCAGLPALAAARPRLAALNALGDAETPARSAIWGLGITLVLGAASLPLNAAAGPALAATVAAWANTALLARALARRGIRADLPAAWLARTLAACALTALPVLGITACVRSDAASVLLGAPAGVIVYLAAARLLRIREAALCLEAARALPGGGKSAAG